MQYKVLFKRCLLAIVVMFVVTSLQAQREMKTINDNWEFRKSIDESWESVNLPHTFNIDAYQQLLILTLLFADMSSDTWSITRFLSDCR